MLTTSEIVIIVAISLLVITPFLGFKLKYKTIYFSCGIILLFTNLFFDRNTTLNIIQMIVIAFPFVIARIRKNDLLKDKYQ